MGDIILKDESYQIVGACMEVHKQLGVGFKEIVYKDALEIEFESRNITFSRERQFKIEYKGKTLRHKYNADFIVFDQIILEAKATPVIINPFVAQTINYLKTSGFKLGIIANFGEASFTFKRVIF
ncbi:MAG: GxxExxY protein [Chitinophagaceae bacterium]